MSRLAAPVVQRRDDAADRAPVAPTAAASRRLRAVLVLLAVAAACPGLSAAARVAVVVVPPFAPAQYEDRGAVGLLVPGAGSTVTRTGALAALVRGKVASSLLGGVPSGRPLIRLADGPGPVTVYVSLPSPGRHHNTRRYPIAIVGGGYRGLLTSRSTRIPGLVSIADVAPTAVALERGERSVIRSRADPDAAGTLTGLDRRLRRAHDARTAATIVLVSSVLVLAALALLLRSAVLARAALLAVPSALAVALALAAAGVTRVSVVAAVLGVGTIVVALLGAWDERLLLPLLLAFLGGALVVLAVWPAVNALSVIGPHPDGGGRYFGVTNQVETLLLAPILAAAALVETRWIVLVGVVAVGLVGWSRAGADGGGVLVLLSALLALWALRSGARWTPGRLAAAAAVAAVAALALVGLDAATGGSSHVTRAVGRGPASLVEDIGHRLHVSWAGATSTLQAGLAASLTLLALVGLALLRRRSAVVDALLVGLAVSLLVNDTPTDVLGFGALVAGALRSWHELGVREVATRRSAAAASLRARRARLAR